MRELLYAIREEGTFVLMVVQHMKHESKDTLDPHLEHCIALGIDVECDRCRETRELFNRGYARNPDIFVESVWSFELQVRGHAS